MALSLFWLVWLINEIGDAALRGQMLYIFFEGGADAAAQASDGMIWLGLAYLIIPLVWVLNSVRNFITQPSSRLNTSDTFLLFKQPTSTVGFFLTLGLRPYSSMNIIHQAVVFYFSREKNCYVKQIISPAALEFSYILKMDPPPDFSDFLDEKINSRYHWYKNNCITVLKGSGLKIGWLDFIPSIFIMRLIK